MGLRLAIELTFQSKKPIEILFVLLWAIEMLELQGLNWRINVDDEWCLLSLCVFGLRSKHDRACLTLGCIYVQGLFMPR